jgi:hypothetical protein
MTKNFLVTWLAAAALTSSLPAFAGDGHNHDAGPSAPSGPALPRFSADSDLFELVGVVNGKLLTFYLDRFADNSPVKGASIDLDVDGAKVALKEHAPGEFEGTLADVLKPGLTAVTATIIAGTDSDILAGNFDIHEEAHAQDASAPAWKKYLPWAVSGAVLMALLGWLLRRGAARATRLGGAA